MQKHMLLLLLKEAGHMTGLFFFSYTVEISTNQNVILNFNHKYLQLHCLPSVSETYLYVGVIGVNEGSLSSFLIMCIWVWSFSPAFVALHVAVTSVFFSPCLHRCQDSHQINVEEPRTNELKLWSWSKHMSVDLTVCLCVMLIWDGSLKILSLPVGARGGHDGKPCIPWRPLTAMKYITMKTSLLFCLQPCTCVFAYHMGCLRW